MIDQGDLEAAIKRGADDDELSSIRLALEAAENASRRFTSEAMAARRELLIARDDAVAAERTRESTAAEHQAERNDAARGEERRLGAKRKTGEGAAKAAEQHK